MMPRPGGSDDDFTAWLQPLADKYGLTVLALDDIHSTIMCVERAGLQGALRLLMNKHGIPIGEMMLVVDDLSALDADEAACAGTRTHEVE
jgi:hypothetical protein